MKFHLGSVDWIIYRSNISFPEEILYIYVKFLLGRKVVFLKKSSQFYFLHIISWLLVGYNVLTEGMSFNNFPFKS